MTPGIKIAKAAGVHYRLHQYSHDPAHHSYGTEAAEKLGVPAEKIFKTLVVSLDATRLAVAVVPVNAMLNMKLIAKVAGAKKAEMAKKIAVEKTTGYVLGGVSPLGQKKCLPTFVDVSAKKFAAVYVSAGRRGLEIELAPNDLVNLTAGQYAVLVQ